MSNFQLEQVFHISGIGSASGLIYKDDSIYLISDNANHLFKFDTQTKKLAKIPLSQTELTANIPKKLKPDFEAMAHFGNDFYIFGSGSTENRNGMVRYNAIANTIKSTDLTPLYLSMQDFGNIKPQDFNIEGVVFTGAKWYFLQRGNGQSGYNGIFTVSGGNLDSDFTLLFHQYALPKINGIQSSFTDAVLVADRLYFLACTENIASTYEDGEILGSFVGWINIATMKIGSTQKISDSHKFEGITLFQKEATTCEFLLCEDNDTEKLASDIYKLVWED